jgi:hypothetical protein
MTITNPVVNRVFNDLEEYRSYCTTEVDRNGNPLPFNEADLYNEKSWTWKNFKKWQSWQQRVKQRSSGYKGRKNA